MAPDGSFVVAWEDDRNENSIYQIRAAGFNSMGTRRFGDITVNADLRGQQLKPEVAMAPDGSFVVTWEDDRNENGTYQIRAARFNSTGATRLFYEADITVNEDSSGQQRRPDVAVDTGSNLVVVWEDDINANGYTEIFGRGLDPHGR
jgi:hypothetical protein